MLEPCEFLDWDTDFFGHRIARVRGHQLSWEGIGEALRWCQFHQVECLYCLADTDHPGTVQQAEADGFHLVDIRITLQRDREDCPAEPAAPTAKTAMVRPFQNTDLPGLQEIARASHHDSRFYSDPHFPVESCDALYETWIRRSCAGYADTVLVADVARRPVGYVSCHLPGEEPHGRIGLVGVDPLTRGQGIGRALVSQALDWFARHGVGLVQVVTQGRNTAAQRLYQRCGFLTHQVQIWYHKWMPPYLPDNDR